LNRVLKYARAITRAVSAALANFVAHANVLVPTVAGLAFAAAFVAFWYHLPYHQDVV
jgi:hypothetical protein